MMSDPPDLGAGRSFWSIITKRASYIYRCERGAAVDQVGGFFRDHDDRRVDVAADEVGHHRGIDDAQPVDAQHLELGIDDRHWVDRPSHFAGAERVVNGDRSRADMRIDLAVRAAVRTRQDFSGREGAKRLLAAVSVARKFCWMRTGARGSAEASSIRPRLSGRSNTARQPKLSA